MLTAGAESVRGYLPAGVWVPLWSRSLGGAEAVSGSGGGDGADGAAASLKFEKLSEPK